MASQQRYREISRELWQNQQRVTPFPSQTHSKKELRELAIRGQARSAILLAFVRDFDAPLNAAEFTAHLERYRQEGTRDLMRNGYRLRLAERDVMGARMLVPLGHIEDALRSGSSPQEKTVAIAEYIDAHETIGLSDTVRLYVLAPFGDVHSAFDDLLEIALEANRAFIDDNVEMQSELYSRYMAYGYAYRVAEELVAGDLPADWKPSQSNTSAEEPGGPETRSEPIPPWAYFHGKSNTASVLCEKAKVVAHLIDTTWNDALVLSAPIRAECTGPRARLEEEQARRIMAENAALFLRIVDEVSFSALGAELSDKFIETLAEFVALELQGRGLKAENFAGVLKERLAEYAGYLKWVPGRGESAKGTLLWEFAKKVADILCIGKSALFSLLLSNVLLESLTEWRLPELLRGIDDQASPLLPH